MRQHDLDICREWFDRYCRSFLTDNPEDRRNIELKIFHTDRVFENAGRICAGEWLDPKTLLLARTAGLLHDVGRFPQYARFRTYQDSVSVNHGRLGADVLMEEHVLDPLDTEDRGTILDAVRFHNAFTCPDLADTARETIIRIVRDSDKLDIWKIFCDLDDYARADRPSAAALGLPDLPDYSEAAIRCLQEQRPVALSDLTTLNDLRLMQLSWIYDLNFPSSFRLLGEAGFIDRYASHLPGTGEIRDSIDILKDFVREKAGLPAGPGLSGGTDA
ncbi:MAG: HD domain-containing protein [Thermodesulfovibrionales bacterium]